MYKKIFAAVVAFFFIAGLTTWIHADEKKLDGKEIFLTKKCEACHAVEKAGIEAKMKITKAPDLSKVDFKDKSADFLKKYLMKEEVINDKKHAIKFNGSEEELIALIDWILQQKKTEEEKPKE